MKKSSVLYTCNDGFEMVGDNPIKCLWDGSWSSQPPKCVTEGNVLSFLRSYTKISILGLHFLTKTHFKITKMYSIFISNDGFSRAKISHRTVFAPRIP